MVAWHWLYYGWRVCNVYHISMKKNNVTTTNGASDIRSHKYPLLNIVNVNLQNNSIFFNIVYYLKFYVLTNFSNGSKKIVFELNNDVSFHVLYWCCPLSKCRHRNINWILLLKQYQFNIALDLRKHQGVVVLVYTVSTFLYERLGSHIHTNTQIFSLSAQLALAINRFKIVARCVFATHTSLNTKQPQKKNFIWMCQKCHALWYCCDDFCVHVLLTARWGSVYERMF